MLLPDCCCGFCCWPNGLLPNGLCGVCSSLLDWMVRSFALMMPAVTEPSSPSGLPSARTVSPTCIWELSPSVAALRPDTPDALTTARSVRGSVPTMSAVAFLPFAKMI